MVLRNPEIGRWDDREFFEGDLVDLDNRGQYFIVSKAEISVYKNDVSQRTIVAYFRLEMLDNKPLGHSVPSMLLRLIRRPTNEELLSCSNLKMQALGKLRIQQELTSEQKSLST